MNLLASREVIDGFMLLSELATTAAAFRRRFTRISGSESEKSEEDSEAGGWVAGRLRMLEFLEVRFLKRFGGAAEGASDDTASSMDEKRIAVRERERVAG